MEEKIYQIFDKAIKKSLTLSQRAVIQFINAGFHTDYPLDSTITYNWTENYDDELKKTIADGILTINNQVSYHIEGQIGKDEEMQFRVFNYGYYHALKHRNGMDVLRFPEPLIIYLCKADDIPDVQKLLLDFGEQGEFEYKVRTFKLLSHTLEDLDKSKMLILLPFMILKFRDKLEKRRTREDLLELKNYIVDDIIRIINENVKSGNLTLADGNRLRNLIGQLYRYLYADYEECEKEGINDMVEEGLVLEMDIIEYNHKKELEQKEKDVKEEVTTQLVKNAYESVKNISEVAKLLKLSEDEVQDILGK